MTKMGESSSRGTGVWSEEESPVMLHNLSSVLSSVLPILEESPGSPLRLLAIEGW